MVRPIKGFRPGQKGFTLIELLAVMAILATLVAIVAPAVTGSREASLQAQALQDATQVRTAANKYFSSINESEVRTPHTVDTTSTIAAAVVTGAKQVVSSRWPEKYITLGANAPDAARAIGALYSDVFETAATISPTVAAITLLDSQSLAIDGKQFLERYTAVDFGSTADGKGLVGKGYLAKLPAGVDMKSETKPNFLWLLSKTSSSSAAERADDSRDVAVFKLVKVEKIEGAGAGAASLNLTYQLILGSAPAVVVTPRPTATKLAFSTQPSGVVAGTAFTTVVTVLDSSNGVATTSTAAVTVALGANPCGGTLSGTTTVAAVNGVATFSDLSIDKACTYTLTATSSGLDSATSSVFEVTGNPWAWGYNTYGWVGDGTTTTRLAPVPVSGLSGVTAVATGAYHSLALEPGGTVKAWGHNPFGALGDGTAIDRLTPVPVGGLSGVAAVAAGAYHSLALKSDGTVWAWGRNIYGSLGDGSTTDRLTPVPVSGLSGVVAVAAAYHSLALKPDGTVWAWGWNDYGQLGDGTTTNRLTPVQVSGLSGVKAIAAGWSHSLALRSDGTVWAWGNIYGQFGDAITTNLTPVQVSGLSGVTAIAGGGYHALARKSDGTVWAWGYNAWGELGDGTTISRLTPGPVSGLSGVTAIAAGYRTGRALQPSGALMTWGYNYYGSLGDGTTTDRLTPVPVSGLSGVIAVATGSVSEFGLALVGAPGTNQVVFREDGEGLTDGQDVPGWTLFDPGSAYYPDPVTATTSVKKVGNAAIRVSSDNSVGKRLPSNLVGRLEVNLWMFPATDSNTNNSFKLGRINDDGYMVYTVQIRINESNTWFLSTPADHGDGSSVGGYNSGEHSWVLGHYKMDWTKVRLVLNSTDEKVDVFLDDVQVGFGISTIGQDGTRWLSKGVYMIGTNSGRGLAGHNSYFDDLIITHATN